jgi:hypothetical protein
MNHKLEWLGWWKDFLILLCFMMTFIGCTKDELDSSSQRILKFGADTVTFDTVFQTIGSATRSVRIYNPSSKSIVLSKVYLNQGSASQYRFNIDGSPSPIAQNITILPRDSAWIFIEVTINPNTNSLVVQDSLVVESNGGRQFIILHAYGQNAYYHRGEIINSNTTWLNDKPHVILSQNTSSGFVPGVIIPSGRTLTIAAGCNLYFGSNAGLLVQGNLRSLGTASSKINMRGLRLEKQYLKAAGQWLGILIERRSINNLIEYTSIDETAFGIWMGFQATTNYAAMTDASRANLILRNSSVKNGYYWTLRSLNNEIRVENCEFYTATDYLAQLYLGGNYTFVNSTFFNIQSKDQKGLLALSNQIYDDVSKSTFKNKLTLAKFENCIFQTNADEAISIALDTTINQISDYLFQNCIYTSKSNFSNASFVDCIRNQDAKFTSTSIDKENLKPIAGSPAIDKGLSNTLTNDINGEARPKGGQVDIGAYEF